MKYITGVALKLFYIFLNFMIGEYRRRHLRTVIGKFRTQLRFERKILSRTCRILRNKELIVLFNEFSIFIDDRVINIQQQQFRMAYGRGVCCGTHNTERYSIVALYLHKYMKKRARTNCNQQQSVVSLLAQFYPRN